MKSVFSILLLCFLLAACWEEKTVKTEEEIDEKTIRERAEVGDADAQVQLDLLYEIDQGAPGDFAEAYMWINLAAAGGNKEYGELRGLLEKRMMREQLV